MVPPCQGLIGVESDDEGTGMSNPALAEGGVITMHAGIQGGADLTVADHGWTNPVARITVSVSDSMMDDADSMMDDAMMDDADSMESGMDTSLPSAGTGPVDAGNSLVWFYFAAVAGAVLVVVGGALRLRRTAQLSS